ncbi:MAG TPA: class I SAM-dependent methyltransferase, partial [Candidatus Eisenbacteria bacterium]
MNCGIEALGATDIYLIDQIMKGRYAAPASILDAGAGHGRNLSWFAKQGLVIHGTDRDAGAVEQLRRNYPGVPAENFQVALVDELPFSDARFDHVICCAVLHFAESESHFRKMFGELVRVLKPGGSLFARVATDVGLADRMIPLGHGRFTMPDGSDRFLLTRSLLASLLDVHRL